MVEEIYKVRGKFRGNRYVALVSKRFSRREVSFLLRAFPKRYLLPYDEEILTNNDVGILLFPGGIEAFVKKNRNFPTKYLEQEFNFLVEHYRHFPFPLPRPYLFIRHGEEAYLAMEYWRDVTPLEMILPTLSKKERLNAYVVVTWMLSVLHENSFFYRDPHFLNILVTWEGDVRLVDFELIERAVDEEIIYKNRERDLSRFFLNVLRWEALHGEFTTFFPLFAAVSNAYKKYAHIDFSSTLYKLAVRNFPSLVPS